jgi:hypothetical protein
MSENKAQCLVSKNKALRIIRGGTLQRIPDLWSSPLEKVSKIVGFRLVEEVEDPKTTLSASGSLRVVRGRRALASRRAAAEVNAGDARVGYRSRNIGLRLVEEVIGE